MPRASVKASLHASISPLLIFQGALKVWHNNQNLSMMFADYVGTAATVGSAVALQLDSAQGDTPNQPRGSELRANGVVGLVGTATAATYNTGTGAGSITRAADASNQSYLRWTGMGDRLYALDLEVLTGTSVNVRSGGEGSTTIATLTAGQRRTVYVMPASTNITLTSGANNTTATFTVHSVKECLGSPRYQTTAAQRPILGRHPKGGRRNVLLATATMGTQSATVTAVPWTLSFKGTGTVTLSGASTAGPLVGTGASDRVTLTFTPSAGSLTLTVSGSVTEAQLELGSSATNYQAVTTTYDCTETGVPDCYFLQADGSDDGMVTPAVDLSATDKIGVFAAVRKLSDAATGMVVELGNGIPQAFYVTAPGGGLATETFGGCSRGTSAVFPSAGAAYASPFTVVLTLLGNIGDDSAILRVDGSVVDTETGDQGTGNFSNAALYYYRRGGSSLPFNGLDYGNFITTGTPTAGQIAQAEAYQNNYVGAY